ncbi:hypothetical protein [Roseivirga sp. UBA1976]|uniref:hypothetical protein n=1 Tax=Roseivirga sp. UBA1976 TaxID=1947386 RepID=UPI00257B209E|nr:hypothetical protein [Roseivirga sp. UBA1976]MEC7753043.1 hypothetical protein [Bacteroidota bacterium]|tara:strand:- start:8068 stop:8982 length:915 start_codon:yes stop_codon:yes gene_type:complete
MPFKASFIYLLVVICLNSQAQNLEINGVLRETGTTNGIPYATIIDITTNKYGTTSNVNGTFSLVLPKDSENNLIYISSLGFKDTTLVISELLKHDIIYLQPKSYDLPDFIVSSTKSKEIKIGDSQASIAQQDGKTKGYQASSGFSWGAYFKTQNKDTNALLESIDIYIGNTGFPEAPLMLRFFEFKGDFEFFRSQPRSTFNDLHNEPIIINAEKSGWLHTNISAFNIRIPDGGLYCLFTPLDKGSKYIYETEQGLKYGASIGIYAEMNSGKNIYPVFQDKDKLTVVKRTNAPSPAVSIVFIREN